MDMVACFAATGVCCLAALGFMVISSNRDERTRDIGIRSRWRGKGGRSLGDVSLRQVLGLEMAGGAALGLVGSVSCHT